MATIIQLKRSTVTASPTGLANGEAAFSGTSNSLFIGSPDGSGASIRIGGGAFAYVFQSTPGTLTVNAAMITDGNGFITNVFSEGLSLGASKAGGQAPIVTTINATANSTVLGTPSNSELTTTWAIKTYVDGKVAGSSGSPGGANTDVQFNDSGTFAGLAAFTFDKTTNIVFVSNTINVGANVSLTTGLLTIGNSTINTQINSTFIVTGTGNYSIGVNVGANVNISTSTLTIGNSTVNAIANSILIELANSTSSANHTQGGFTAGISLVNTTAMAVGANVILTSVALQIGNSTVNTFANSLLIELANSTSSANMTQAGFVTGISTVNTTAVSVGSNTIINATVAFLGNTTANLVANSTQLTVINSTSTASLNPLNLSIGNSTANVQSNSTVLSVQTAIGINTHAPSVSLTIVANDAIQLPVGNVTQRPTGNTGQLRYNSIANNLEVFANSNWFPVQKGWQGTQLSGTPIVEDVSTNILLQSGNFTVTWAQVNVAITTSAVEDVFGGATAQLLANSNTTSTNTMVNQVVSVANDTGGYAASVYVNKNSTSTNSSLQILFTNSTGTVLTFGITFNAQTGAVSATTGAVTSWGAHVYNNGWTRIDITANNNNTTANSITFQIFADNSNTQKNLIVMAPQLEKNINTTSYILTTTTAGTRPAGKINQSTLPMNTFNFTSDNTGFMYLAAANGGTY